MEHVLRHHGILGQKWGVRRKREEIDLDYKNRLKKRKVISGHSPTPKIYKPLGIIDKLGNDGKVICRTNYDSKGIKQKDIHTYDHGNPKQHNFGKKGEHVVEYEWSKDGTLQNKKHRDLSALEKRLNGDIL